MPCATCSTGRIIYRWGPNPGILLESVGERDPERNLKTEYLPHYLGL
jgi:hypothetical protein